MERGGLLSHGAIVAREFGIPAVVGVVDAQATIAQDAIIEIDGDRGRVTIVDDTARTVSDCSAESVAV